MGPALRKFVLTAHVASSVGWLGAVVAFFALAVVGLKGVASSYFAMNVIGLWVIVPMSIGSILTGLVHSLGTDWGLVRHWWVLSKFVLALGATVLLLLHQFTAVSEAARRAGAGVPVGRVGVQLAGDSTLALLVLLVATTLSVYKPWGKTRFVDPRAPTPMGVKVLASVVAVIGLLAFAAMHLAGAHGH